MANSHQSCGMDVTRRGGKQFGIISDFPSRWEGLCADELVSLGRGGTGSTQGTGRANRGSE